MLSWSQPINPFRVISSPFLEWQRSSGGAGPLPTIRLPKLDDTLINRKLKYKVRKSRMFGIVFSTSGGKLNRAHNVCFPVGSVTQEGACNRGQWICWEEDC